MTSDSLFNDLVEVFDKAKSDVPVYRELYRNIECIKSLAEFAKLPVVTKSLFASHGLKGSLANGVRLCLTRTYEDVTRKDCVPRMLSYEDAVDDFELLSVFMKPMIADCDRKHRIMLIGDELHIYAIAELANQLAYYEIPLTVFIVRRESEDRLRAHLEWFRPTAVFLNAFSQELNLDSVRYLFTFNQSILSTGRSDYHQSVLRLDILQDTFVGPLAIKRSDEPFYRFDPDLFYFENAADDGLLVTSLSSQLQPLIRYKLPYRGLASAETLVITGAN